ncbi:MAG: hypothetical protein M3O71_15370 [Bacteroidota bacterium]|nr:hypothetical protein [Bacteroidota bacterium]
MQETAGMLEKIWHHDKVCIALNQNWAIPLPGEVMRVLARPTGCHHLGTPLSILQTQRRKLPGLLLQRSRQTVLPEYRWSQTQSLTGPL